MKFLETDCLFDEISNSSVFHFLMHLQIFEVWLIKLFYNLLCLRLFHVTFPKRCLKVVRDPIKVDSQRKKMNFSAKDFLSKNEQIRIKIRICSHLLKKYLREIFVFAQCLLLWRLVFKNCNIRPFLYVFFGLASGKSYHSHKAEKV